MSPLREKHCETVPRERGSPQTRQRWLAKTGRPCRAPKVDKADRSDPPAYLVLATAAGLAKALILGREIGSLAEPRNMHLRGKCWMRVGGDPSYEPQSFIRRAKIYKVQVDLACGMWTRAVTGRAGLQKQAMPASCDSTSEYEMYWWRKEQANDPGQPHLGVDLRTAPSARPLRARRGIGEQRLIQRMEFGLHSHRMRGSARVVGCVRA